jgi:hypothetical protein
MMTKGNVHLSLTGFLVTRLLDIHSRSRRNEVAKL